MSGEVARAVDAALDIVAAASSDILLDHNKKLPAISVLILYPDLVLNGATALHIVLGDLQAHANFGEPALVVCQRGG